MIDYSRSLEGLAKWLFIVLIIAPLLGTASCSGKDSEVAASGDSVMDGDVQGGIDTGPEDNWATDASTGNTGTEVSGDGDTNEASGDGASLAVKFSYQGSVSPDSVTVYLFAQEDGQPRCADIDPNSLSFPAFKTSWVPGLKDIVKFQGFSGFSDPPSQSHSPKRAGVETGKTFYTCQEVALTRMGTGREAHLRGRRRKRTWSVFAEKERANRVETGVEGVDGAGRESEIGRMVRERVEADLGLGTGRAGRGEGRRRRSRHRG